MLLIITAFFAVSGVVAQEAEPSVEPVAEEWADKECTEEKCPNNPSFKLWLSSATSDVFKQDEDGNLIPDTNLEGWNSWLSSIISIIAIIASCATIAGLGSLFFDIRRRKVTTKCQKLVVIDLVRHFAINLAILEGVKLKMKEDKRPEEGTFMRFATLDSDVDLGRLSVTAANYENIHAASLSIRNFNLETQIVDRHFVEAKTISGNRLLVDDIENIDKRMRDIIKKLWVVQNAMGYALVEERIGRYFVERYSRYDRFDADSAQLKDVVAPLFWEHKKNDASEKLFANALSSYSRNRDYLRLAYNWLYLHLALCTRRSTPKHTMQRNEALNYVKGYKVWREGGIKSDYERRFKQCILGKLEDLKFY